MAIKRRLAVYLAGPLPTDGEWRKKVVSTLEDQEYSVQIFNPETIEEEKHNVDVVNLDKFYIARSDVVLANVTKMSTGTPMEIMYGWMLNKMVILVCPDNLVTSWHLRHSTFHYTHLHDAIDRILHIVKYKCY